MTTDPRIAWCDIYLRAIDMRSCNCFTETALEGIEYVMMLCRDEIEKLTPQGDADEGADSSEPSAPYISFEGGMARMVYPDGPE